MHTTTVALLLIGAPLLLHAQSRWPPHSLDRPRPPVVDPGAERPPAPPPTDAIVLYDGGDLAQWMAGDSSAARWLTRDGWFEVAPGTGSLRTRRAFGAIQLHLEWSTPNPPRGTGQDRGNSGLFLMGRYEIQILDSWRNDTYADGQAAALYGQVPPLVNACRAPGQWQSYDIVFHPPTFAPDGSVRDSARVTVLHNGILVHDARAFTGGTTHGRVAVYSPHGPTGSIVLQDHDHAVRFRNVWVRELAAEAR